MRISDWSSDVCSSDLLLHIASLRLVAGIHQFQPLQRSVVPPCLQFTGMESFVCRPALAEQQPVALVTGVDARFQQRPHYGQAGPVAHPQQGPIFGGDAAAGIGPSSDAQHTAGYDADAPPPASKYEEHTARETTPRTE